MQRKMKRRRLPVTVRTISRRIKSRMWNAAPIIALALLCLAMAIYIGVTG